MQDIKMTEETQAVQKKLSMLEEAKATAERIEAGNLKTEELMKQQAEAKATDLLSGTAEQPQPVVKKEEVNALDYATNALKGIVPEKK